MWYVLAKFNRRLEVYQIGAKFVRRLLMKLKGTPHQYLHKTKKK